jgi:hypothetical protein
MTTVTFNPHGGYAYTNDFLSSVSWHTEVITNGDLSNEDTAGDLFQVTAQPTSSDCWRQIIRTFYAFDTSSITGTINSATLTLIGTAKEDNTLDGLWELGVYSATLTDPEHVDPQDYQLAGTTLLSSTIAYSSFNEGGNNVFTFDATGRAYINKTGYTIICIRDKTHDVADELDPNNHNPNWVDGTAVSNMKWTGSGNSTPGNKPLLTINYTDAPVTGASGASIVRRHAYGGI